MMLIVPHTFADDIDDECYYPTDEDSAKFAWNCICDLFVEAFKYYDNGDDILARWCERVEALHNAMHGIDGSNNDTIVYNYLECDACEITLAVKALVKYRLASDFKEFFFKTANDSVESMESRLSFDLSTVFLPPTSFPSTVLTLRVRPDKLDETRQILWRANDIINWMKCKKNGVKPWPNLRETMASTPLMVIESESGRTTNYGIQGNTVAIANSQANAYGGAGGNAEINFTEGAIQQKTHVEAPNLSPLAEIVRLALGTAQGQPPTQEAPQPDDPIPPLNARVSRSDIATKLGKTTDTLKGWEVRGQGPDGIFWPKAEVTANNAFYNFREVWQSLLSLLPDTDRIQQIELIEGLSITKRP